jgi:hypothetical protein
MDAPASDFEVRTKAELTMIAAQAARCWPSHNCPEKAPCRLCAHHRLLHKRIDDHLEQLEIEALERELTA